MTDNTHPKLYKMEPMLVEIDPKSADLPISFPSSERDFDVDALIRHARRLIERDTLVGHRGQREEVVVVEGEAVGTELVELLDGGVVPEVIPRADPRGDRPGA